MEWSGLLTALLGLVLWFLRRGDGSYYTRRAQAALDLESEAARRTAKAVDLIERREVDSLGVHVGELLDSHDALNVLLRKKSPVDGGEDH